MDVCRLSINAGGAFLHPLGDQTPIDCRYGELLDTVALPHKALLVVSEETLVDFGGLRDPRCVIVWNLAGQGLQKIPEEREAEAIAASVLLVGLIGEPAGGEPVSPGAWQELRPAKPLQDLGGNTILWLAAGARVVLRPANPGTRVLARVLVIPGPDRS